jgi:hypothetical protein
MQIPRINLEQNSPIIRRWNIESILARCPPEGAVTERDAGHVREPRCGRDSPSLQIDSDEVINRALRAVKSSDYEHRIGPRRHDARAGAVSVQFEDSADGEE